MKQLTSEDAVAKAAEFNVKGRHRKEWFYFPAYHTRHKSWFVARRPYKTVIMVAVFCDGSISRLENSNDENVD